jgi:hypothetical protein
MHLIYIDESGNTGLNLKDPQQPVFVLSALLIKEEIWFSLEREYHSILEKHLPHPLPDDFELHAMQLKNGSGAFKGKTLAQRISLRDDILSSLCNYKTPVIYMRIIKKAFEKFCIDNYGPGIHVDPYIMALPFICIEVDNYLKEKASNAFGMLIFDEQKEYFTHAERSIRILRLDKASVLKTTNIVEKGFFVDSKKCYVLQFSDLVTYYVRKYEEDKLGLRVSDIDKQAFPYIVKMIVPGEYTRQKDIFDWVKQTWV